MLRHKSLVVVNVKTSEEKKLPSDCSVSFSTDSSYNSGTYGGREGRGGRVGEWEGGREGRERGSGGREG